MYRNALFILALVLGTLAGCGGQSATSPTPPDAPLAADTATDTIALDLPAAPDRAVPGDAVALDVPADRTVALDATTDVTVVDVVGASDTPAVAPDTNACPAGRTRCGDACLDLQSDPVHCGSCAGTCRALPGINAVTITCDRGSCTVHDHCADTFADCDGTAANGCETDLSRATSCGACGIVCSGATSTCAMVMGDGGLVTRAPAPTAARRQPRPAVMRPASTRRSISRTAAPATGAARSRTRHRIATAAPARSGRAIRASATATVSPRTAARWTSGRPRTTAGRATTPAPSRTQRPAAPSARVR